MSQRRDVQKPHPKKEQAIVQATTHYQGPIPPPQLLKQYDEISPGFADRIIRMAESETAHRQQAENKALDADIKFASREYDERRIG
jgi:uncharacterized membrane protein